MRIKSLVSAISLIRRYYGESADDFEFEAVEKRDGKVVFIGMEERSKTMQRFEIYDTKGQRRLIDTVVDIDDIRARLSEFKTHCVVEKKAYEFNHFVNWLNKNFSDVTIVGDRNVDGRVDM